MSANKKAKALIQASSKTCDKENQHILLSLSPEGDVTVSGSDNLVSSLISNIELFSKVKDCMRNNLTQESVIHSVAQNVELLGAIKTPTGHKGLLVFL